MDRKQNSGIGVERTDPREPLLGTDTRETVARTAQQVEDQAAQAARQAASEAGRVADEVKQTAYGVAAEVDRATDGVQREVGQQAREVGRQVERAAVSQVERGRHQVAQGVHAAAEALRLGAEQVRQREGAAGTQFVERLAEPVERVSNYLERHDTREIARDLEDFARRNEGLFLGGAFALGVLGARFLKASSAQAHRARYETMDRYGSRPRGWEPEHDAVTRPGAPGYAPPSERTGDDESGIGRPGTR